VNRGLIDLVQRQSGSRRRTLRLHGFRIDQDPARGDFLGQRGLQGLGRNLGRPVQIGDVGCLGGARRILKRRRARLVPREGYLGRDSIKCLRGRGALGLGAHAGAGSAGGKPKPY
jgi:hypothetical protein